LEKSLHATPWPRLRLFPTYWAPQYALSNATHRADPVVNPPQTAPPFQHGHSRHRP
jgi:hypothetical protein